MDESKYVAFVSKDSGLTGKFFYGPNMEFEVLVSPLVPEGRFIIADREAFEKSGLPAGWNP